MCKSLVPFCIYLFLAGCARERQVDIDTTHHVLFKKVDPARSGIAFDNAIEESLYFNSVVYDNMMTGGGVGLLDVNNDGKLDIYFAGNMVQDRLYLNQGRMHFKDITFKAGIQKTETWTSGLAIADVNGDGWDDIYLCKNVLDDPARRHNLYYENQHDGTFLERAEEMGIADAGYSTTANFFDYDNDGDLDLYVGNQPPSSLYQRPKLKDTIDYQYTDRLYRNDGDRFTEVTDEAGIRNYGYTLSVTTGDFNGDLLPDIYVACDYEEPDIMYINQGDGTFKNVINETMRHISNSAMGTDIADINNDGFEDLFTADMIADDHYRSTTNINQMSPQKFWQLANHGYHYQYTSNTLQLNNGNHTYSEIAQLAGIARTDWSWAVLFLDADDDGWNDVYITNGQMKDVLNKDFQEQRREIIEKARGNEDMHRVLYDISQMTPAKKIKNYFYRNNGDLTFANVTDTWGFSQETWSQGAAYGDLDNDGDLDLVINNNNDTALVYENQINDLNINNYLIVRVEGPGKNTHGFNAIVTTTCGDVRRVGEITPIRGYMSSVEPIAHFGFGSCRDVDTVSVKWPDGTLLTRTHVPANQVLVMRYSEGIRDTVTPKIPQHYFNPIQNQDPIPYTESTYDDYAKEGLLPYRMSTLGPVIATGDVNGDHLEDVYMGGSVGHAGELYLQNPDGTLSPSQNTVFLKDAAYEDGCATFFDADGDKDLDLYVCSGSNEFPANSTMYQDRLYLNDGKGHFSKSDALPEITASTAVAEPMDYDNDGDIDIFVGARQVPGAYGRTPQSILLMNVNGHYQDVGPQVLPHAGMMGMVTDAHWVVLPGMLPQMVVAGEWMRILILQYDGNEFQEQEIPGLEHSEGMWNRVIPVDIDKDGDMDLVAGNCGLNMKYSTDPDNPFTMIVNDFDHNGTIDQYLGYYDQDDGQYYPVRDWESSYQQMPFIKKEYASNADFAKATLQDILKNRMDGAEQLYARIFASGIFENMSGELVFHPFENSAQVAPIYGIVVSDFNHDGHPDLFMAGNYYNREVETVRSDAGIGNLLFGQGGLNFEYVHPSLTGIVANGDVRAAALLKNLGNPVLVIANNGSKLQTYRYSGSGRADVQ